MKLLEVADHKFSLPFDNRMSNSINNKFIKLFLFLHYFLIRKDCAGKESIVVIISSKKLEWFPNLVSMNFMIDRNLSSKSLFFDTRKCFIFAFDIFSVNKI